MPHSKLIHAALAAREQSVAPYSKFNVGAALLTASGEIFSGANVESASYGLSCCAERVALFKALTDGHHNFTTIAIASSGGAAPCGACRQLLAEYAPEAGAILINSESPDTPETTTVNELLPNSFTGEDFPEP